MLIAQRCSKSKIKLKQCSSQRFLSLFGRRRELLSSSPSSLALSFTFPVLFQPWSTQRNLQSNLLPGNDILPHPDYSRPSASSSSKPIAFQSPFTRPLFVSFTPVSAYQSTPLVSPNILKCNYLSSLKKPRAERKNSLIRYIIMCGKKDFLLTSEV